MAIEAPVSRYKKTNYIIYIIVCIILALWFGYDGYFNKDFIAENSNEDGSANPTLIFNQKSPPFFIGGAILLGLYFFSFRNKKIIAGENELIISNKLSIPYDSIEQIDKTHFQSKGRFEITYKNQDSTLHNYALSGANYDNLKEVLDYLVAKIS